MVVAVFTTPKVRSTLPKTKEITVVSSSTHQQCVRLWLNSDELLTQLGKAFGSLFFPLSSVTVSNR